MLRHLFISLLTAILSIIPSYNLRASSRATKALDSLDIYVKKQNEYEASKINSLNKQKKHLSDATITQQLDIYNYLSREYRHVDLDSAIHYASLGYQLASDTNNKEQQIRFKLLKITIGPIYGMARESIEEFETIDPNDLPQFIRADYYSSADFLFNYVKDFYSDATLKQHYAELAHQAVDSLLNYLEPGTPNHDFYQANSLLNSGATSKAIDQMIKLLNKTPFNDHLYARTAAIIGSTYINDPYHTDDAIYYLAKSAMSDIATGNRETTSLHRLGKLLYDKGDINRSYNYLTCSLSTAVESRSRLRSLEIAEALPLVFQTVQKRNAEARRDMIIVILILSILLIISIALFFIYDRARRRLARMKTKLTATLELKDNYIRKILLLCGAYLTALENFNRIAGRKIKAGQVSDLLTMIESGKIMKEQSYTFYDIFDSAFLMIYPGFISDVNKLLLPDRQINRPEEERLTPELRILAFMKLGVDDSTQISKFLGLSLNTIYTYRNKIKMRAISRESFEQDIINIGKIS